jgi:hypothetical protein
VKAKAHWNRAILPRKQHGFQSKAGPRLTNRGRQSDSLAGSR